MEIFVLSSVFLALSVDVLHRTQLNTEQCANVPQTSNSCCDLL